MTRRSLDRTPDRITLGHGRGSSTAFGRSDRSRHRWILIGSITGALVLFWLMVQFGQASTDAQRSATSSTGFPPTVAVTSAAAKSDKEGTAPVVLSAEPAAQGPAIDAPQEVIAMLDLRKKELDRREQAVRQAEERLLVLKAELESLLTRSEAMQKQLEEARGKMQKQTAAQKAQQEQRLGERKAVMAQQNQEQKNHAQMQLAKMYESMPAEEAALRLERMPDRKAIEMLRIVKGKTAGAILAQMKADRAAKLTEQLLAPAP